MVSILLIEVLYQVQAGRTTFSFAPDDKSAGVWCRLGLQTLQEDRARGRALESLPEAPSDIAQGCLRKNLSEPQFPVSRMGL